MSNHDEGQKLLGMYRAMKQIRTVEECLIRLFADSEIPGFIHLSIGQEAAAVGVMACLEPLDTLTTTHRGHGHVLARGLELDLFFKEVMGKSGGICGGRGGSMHVSDMRLGIIGANGIVGAGIPIALGSALAHTVRESGGMAVAFFGDGAMAEGVLHETLNIASLWKLPLLLVCEANGWSEFSPTSRQFAAQLHSLAAAFHIPYSHVDGADVESVASTAQRLVAEVRGGGGPRILECATHRVRGHYEGDPQTYRDADELGSAAKADPIRNARELLFARGFEPQVLENLDAEILAMVNDSVNRARLDPPPEFDPACADVYARPAGAGRGGAS